MIIKPPEKKDNEAQDLESLTVCEFVPHGAESEPAAILVNDQRAFTG